MKAIALEIDRAKPTFVFFQDIQALDSLAELRTAARGVQREASELINQHRPNDNTLLTEALTAVQKIASPDQMPDEYLGIKSAGYELSRTVTNGHSWHEEIRQTLRATLHLVTQSNGAFHALIRYVSRFEHGEKRSGAMQKISDLVDRLWDVHSIWRNDNTQKSVMPFTSGIIEHVMPRHLDQMIEAIANGTAKPVVSATPYARAVNMPEAPRNFSVPPAFMKLLTA